MRKYARGWLPLDIIAALPLDLIGALLDAPALRFLHCTKIVKLPRLMRSVQGTLLWRSSNELRALFGIIRLLATVLFVAHYFSCLWWYVQRIQVRAMPPPSLPPPPTTTTTTTSLPPPPLRPSSPPPPPPPLPPPPLILMRLRRLGSHACGHPAHQVCAPVHAAHTGEGGVVSGVFGRRRVRRGGHVGGR